MFQMRSGEIHIFDTLFYSCWTGAKKFVQLFLRPDRESWMIFNFELVSPQNLMKLSFRTPLAFRRVHFIIKPMTMKFQLNSLQFFIGICDQLSGHWPVINCSSENFVAVKKNFKNPCVAIQFVIDEEQLIVMPIVLFSSPVNLSLSINCRAFLLPN